MSTETYETGLPQTVAGATMAGVVREAWLATAELDEVVDSDVRQSAFVLVLEAMLRDGEVETPAEAVDLPDEFDASYDLVEQDDLYPTPELRIDAISSYLGIKAEQVPLLCAVEQADPTLRANLKRLLTEKHVSIREITLLLLGVRTAVALDTDLDEVRRAGEQYCSLDESTSAEIMQSSPECVVMGVRGSERKIVRLRSAGVDAVRELVQQLVSERAPILR